MRGTILLVFIIFYPAILIAQGEFNISEKNGILAGYSHFYNDVISGNGGSISTTLSDKVDLGMSFSVNTLRREDGRDITTSSGSMLGGLNLKTKNGNGNIKTVFGLLVAGDPGFGFGILFHIKILKTEIFNIIPGIGFMYGIFFSSENNRVTREAETYIHNSRSLSLDFNILTNLGKGLNFIIAPSIVKDLTLSDNDVIYGVSTGILVRFF